MKKIVSFVLTLLIMIGLVNYNGVIVKAQDTKEVIDGSYLIENDSSVSSNDYATRGAYLKSGTSTITKAGTGKIGAGGTTVSQTIVSSIGVNVRVERLVNGSWQIYTSWSSTKYSAALVSSSKTLSVPTGYYYRVHCFHSANSDASSSITNGIWI